MAPRPVGIDYITHLERAAVEAAAELAPLPESVASWRPAPDKWSAKEIIGHLIDSAANNHARFVRAPRQTDLVFSGYAQEEWVQTQKYDDAPWADLLELWRAYNRHIAHVMAAVPREARQRAHERHNLHEIGWRQFQADAPATLDDLMRDYVEHLEHHLAQVRDRVRDASRDGSTDAVRTGA